MPFLGEFERTIDAKGRVIMPPSMRGDLAGEVTLSAYLDGCIGVWSMEAWNKLLADFVRLGRGDPQNRARERALTSSAFVDELDRQGRLSVPAKLRQRAGISTKCMVVGARDHAEIWDPETWRPHVEGGHATLGDSIEGFV